MILAVKNRRGGMKEKRKLRKGKVMRKRRERERQEREGKGMSATRKEEWSPRKDRYRDEARSSINSAFFPTSLLKTHSMREVAEWT